MFPVVGSTANMQFYGRRCARLTDQVKQTARDNRRSEALGHVPLQEQYGNAIASNCNSNASTPALVTNIHVFPSASIQTAGCVNKPPPPFCS